MNLSRGTDFPRILVIASCGRGGLRLSPPVTFVMLLEQKLQMHVSAEARQVMQVCERKPI